MLQSHCGNDDSRRKTAISHYTRKIKGRSQVTKMSFTTLLKLSHSVKVIIRHQIIQNIEFFFNSFTADIYC